MKYKYFIIEIHNYIGTTVKVFKAKKKLIKEEAVKILNEYCKSDEIINHPCFRNRPCSFRLVETKMDRHGYAIRNTASVLASSEEL